MVMDRHRDRLDWWLVPLAKSMRHIHPNTVTWISLFVALGAGVAFWQSGPDRLGILVLAGGLTWLNGILDVLDGKIAKMTGRATAKGDYLDHAIDRFADVAFLAGIAFSPWTTVEVGLAAIVFTLLTSYLGTQAQAVGIGRNYGGLLGRADRMILLILLPPIQAILSWQGVALPWESLSNNLLDTGMWYFAVVGALTTLQRFAGGLRAFTPEGGLKP